LKPFGRWILRALLAAATLGAALVIAAAVVLWRCDQDDYRRLAVWGVARYADCRLVVDGTFAVSLGPALALQATGLRFEALPQRPPPALTAVARLDVKIALLPLLFGRVQLPRLALEGVRIVQPLGAASSAAAAGNGAAAFPPRLPLLENVHISGLAADFHDPQSDRTFRIRIEELVLDDEHDAGPLRLKAVGRVNGRPLRIAGTLGSRRELAHPTRPFPVTLFASLAGFETTLSGRVARPLELSGLDLQWQVRAQELTGLRETFDLAFPLPGRLSLLAALSGDFQAPHLRDLIVDLRQGETLALEARGVVDNLRTGAGTDIALQATCRDTALLNRLAPRDWENVERFEFTGRWHSTDGGYALDAVQTRLHNDKQIALGATGTLQFGSLQADFPLQRVDLRLELTTPETASIRPLLTNFIPEIGNVRASARLVGPVTHLALEDLVIERGGQGPVHVTTHGRIGWIPIDHQPVSDMLFDFAITSANSAVLADFYGVPIGEIGRVHLTGRVAGSSERFRLEDVQMETRDAQGLETHVTGGIDFAENPRTAEIEGDIHFQLTFTAPNLRATDPLLHLDLLAPLGPVKARARVAGNTAALSFEDILVQAGTPDQTWAEWRGRIARVPLEGDDPVSGYETAGTLAAARSNTLAALFGLQLPDLGPLRITWHDTDDNGRLGLRDIRLNLGDGRRFDLTGRGAVASVYANDHMAIDGVDLAFQLQAADTQFVNRLLDLSLPDLGPVEGQWRLAGGQKALELRETNLSVRNPAGLQIVAKDSMARFTLAPHPALDRIDVSLEARAPDIRRVPGLDGIALPDLGPLAVGARLQGQADGLTIRPLDVRVGPQDAPVLHLTGRIDHLARPAEAVLDGDLRLDAAPWLPAPPSSAAAAPEAVFSGSLRLQGAAQGQGLDLLALNLSSPGADGLTLKSSGRLRPGAAHPEVELAFDLTAPQPAAWAERLGVPFPGIPGLALDGQYRWQGARHQFEGRTRLGRSTLQTTASLSGQGAKPDFSLRFATPLIHLEDLGLSYAPQPDPEKPLRLAPAKSTKLFGNRPLVLDALHKVDLDMRLEADQVVGRDVQLDRLQGGAVIKNGRLLVGPLTFRHQEGFASLAAEADARAAVPAFKMRLSAEDLDLGDLLAYLHEPLFAQGKLNLLIDLHTAGQTPAALAADLGGTLALALENGRIKRAFNLLAADALDFVFTAPAYDTYTDLRCMALQMAFAQGKGDLQVLYADTPAVRLSGSGHVDLDAQTLEVVLQPEAKRRLFTRASPVKIWGDLADPRVLKIPTEEAAMLAGQILVPYVALPARLVGYLWSMIKGDKDGASPCVDLELQAKP
jgi:uncharacterized protein involved in outer membrane biogenesis